MSGDPSYALMKRIDALVNDTGADAALAMTDIDREASLHGRANSAYSVGEKNRVLRDIFRKRTTEMAGIVSRATHLDATGKLGRLTAGAQQLADRLAGLAWKDYSQAGGPSDRKFFERITGELREQLTADVESLTHDFPTGVVWEQPITVPAPPPTSQVTIHAIHGGIQQVAAGSVVNQTMTVNQAVGKLVATIGEIRASKEYVELDAETRQQLDEIADDLIDEANGATPDAARIEKWGERFMRRLRTAEAWVLEETFKAALIVGMTAFTTPGVAQ